MVKNTYYFSHDYNARNDPKLQKLLMKMGQEGKGIYWDLIEMLYEQDGYLLLDDCESYAFQIRTNYERIIQVIRDFDLFICDEKRFWSESVLRRLNERKIKSEQARKSIMHRWKDTNVIRKEYDSNTIKEIKGKERKEKEIKKEEEVIRRNGINFQFIVDNYHSLCPNMNKVEVINDIRKGFINGRVGEYGMDKVITVLRMAGESDFLNGKNDKAWKADFEWIMRPTNFVKIMEGKYVNPKSIKKSEMVW